MLRPRCVPPAPLRPPCAAASPLRRCVPPAPLRPHCAAASPLRRCVPPAPLRPPCAAASPLRRCVPTAPLRPHCAAASPLRRCVPTASRLPPASPQRRGFAAPGPYRGRFLGKPRRAIFRFSHQDASTPPSPLVGEGGRGMRGKRRGNAANCALLLRTLPLREHRVPRTVAPLRSHAGSSACPHAVSPHYGGTSPRQVPVSATMPLARQSLPAPVFAPGSPLLEQRRTLLHAPRRSGRPNVRRPR